MQEHVRVKAFARVALGNCEIESWVGAGDDTGRSFSGGSVRPRCLEGSAEGGKESAECLLAESPLIQCYAEARMATAGTALAEGGRWRLASVAAVHDETALARTIVLEVPGWPGHIAGQHVDLRLTAENGYSTARSYSVANAPTGERVELTVVRLHDGEVSPYLTQDLSVGDSLEIRGPIGGWFVWRPTQIEPVQLVAGGSGLVPLMSMIRSRALFDSNAPFRMLYSVRDPESVLYRDELRERNADVPVTFAYTRRVPDGWPESPRRIDAASIAAAAWGPSAAPTCYVCGPTAFVELAADLLIRAGHDRRRVKTERFGPTGS
jgi:ferredoxin-NADP reductase